MMVMISNCIRRRNNSGANDSNTGLAISQDAAFRYASRSGHIPTDPNPFTQLQVASYHGAVPSHVQTGAPWVRGIAQGSNIGQRSLTMNANYSGGGLRNDRLGGPMVHFKAYRRRGRLEDDTAYLGELLVRQISD
jgi:hypothetical protein